VWRACCAERSPKTRIVVAEPDNSPVLKSGIAQAFDASGDPGRQPSVLPAARHAGLVAGFHFQADARCGRRQARRRNRRRQRCGGVAARARTCNAGGIFCGTSSGATFAAALAVGRRALPGANILCMLPDTGERYLSTPLFEDIPVEMTDEEQALSNSTPGYRFGAPPSPAPSVVARTTGGCAPHPRQSASWKRRSPNPKRPW